METFRSIVNLGGKWLDENRNLVMGAGAVVAVLLARKIIATKKKQKLRYAVPYTVHAVLLLSLFRGYLSYLYNQILPSSCTKKKNKPSQS